MLKVVGKLIIRIATAGLLLAFGFWLILASSIGPAYLPEVRNGALDIWIRLSMLGTGAVIWIATVIWFVWILFRYVHQLIKRTK